MYKYTFSYLFFFYNDNRFVNFVSLDCDVAGVEYIDAASKDSPWGGATIQDSLIVGESELTTMGSFQVVSYCDNNNFLFYHTI